MDQYNSDRDWINELTEILEHVDEESLIEYINNIETKWINRNKLNYNNIISTYIKNFNIENFRDIDANYIDLQKDKNIFEITKIIKALKKYELYNENFKIKIENILACIYYADKTIKSLYHLDKINTLKNYNNLLNEDTSVISKFNPENYENTTPYQNLLLYLIDEISDLDLARFGDCLYQQKKTIEGYSTFAWTKYMKISDFIVTKCKRTHKFDQWKNMTSNNQNIKNAVEYFKNCPTDELLALEKDRHVFTFKNGIFLTKHNIGTVQKPIWRSLFIPHGTKNSILKSNTVSSKYFDVDFNNFDNINKDEWFKLIELCPNFKKILDYQEFDSEVQKMLIMFMGRCGYEIGELDNIQAIMFLLGAGGTGKTTILMKILAKFYEEEDVGIIPNNIERQFGLKPHINKKLVLAPEVQGDCKLEQTDWQLICEGGKGTFAEKNKNAESDYWNVPMAMAGNQVINYNNNGGQVSRRTVVFNFWKKVLNTDTDLDKKLEKEIPIIMKMCIDAYLWFIEKYPGKGIWELLPKYFHDNKDDMEETTNSLLHFIKSGKIKLDVNKYVPEKIFKQYFNDHCKENNFRKEKFTTDYYMTTFSNYNIQVKKNIRKRYPIEDGKFFHGTFIIGFDIKYDDDDDDDNNDNK